MKEFLSRHGITFIEKDVSQDEQALQELVKLNIMTTPLTTYGEEIIVGFDKTKLQALIEKSKE